MPQTTLEDMHLWAYGFLGFAEDFFEEFHGDEDLFLCPARFCQDSVENTFGMIRQGGGAANNPSVQQAAKQLDVTQQRRRLRAQARGSSSYTDMSGGRKKHSRRKGH